MMYLVEAVTTAGCDCDDCREGRHLYRLLRWRDSEWRFAALSLQSYASPEECKRCHRWGLDFRPGDVWEDGTPLVEPERVEQAQAKEGSSDTEWKCQLDTEALLKSFEAVQKHWRV